MKNVGNTLTEMKQYNINGKTITLKVKKSPTIVRAVMFFFSFVSFILPLIALIAGIIMGKGLHIGYLIGLFLFGILGFYLLRVSLWNTYGSETIRLLKSKIEYGASYGWFKDGQKSISSNDFIFSINQIGHEEDNIGTLTIEDGNKKIESVVKMPINEIEELIEIIKNHRKHLTYQT